MNELHLRLSKDQYLYVTEEAKKRGISISEYIRLLIQSSMENENSSSKAIATLQILELPIRERKRLLRKLIREEQKTNALDDYIEGILNNNPKIHAWDIYEMLRWKFKIRNITPAIKKQVRRKKKTLNKKISRFRQRLETEKTKSR